MRVLKLVVQQYISFFLSLFYKKYLNLNLDYTNFNCVTYFDAKKFKQVLTVTICAKALFYVKVDGY